MLARGQKRRRRGSARKQLLKPLPNNAILPSCLGLWVERCQDRALNLATEKIMMVLQGDKSVIDIAFELELPLATVRQFLDRFVEVGLIDKSWLAHSI